MDLDSKEFELSDQQFGYICQQVKERTGINLTSGKRNLVYNRLASRLRGLGLDTFDDYFAILKTGNSDEVEQFVNAITTNVTSFFREEHHFVFLAERLKEIAANAKGRPRIRVWSAGCSKGMEPHSIAMVMAETLGDLRRFDVKILATDLDTKVLEQGASGVYDEDVLDGISAERTRRFVLKGKGARAGKVRIRPELTGLITFRHLNLMESWPVRGPFDLIFCRNVAIYFDRPTQSRLWQRFGELLKPEGHLIVGHSESVLETSTFRPLGKTTYQKVGAR